MEDNKSNWKSPHRNIISTVRLLRNCAIQKHAPFFSTPPPKVEDNPVVEAPPDSGNNHSSSSKQPAVLDRCNVDHFDAVAVIRSELWVFVGQQFWRLGAAAATPSTRVEEHPVDLSAFWYGLPESALARPGAKVDAVYERPDHRIVFFVGRHFFCDAGQHQGGVGAESVV